MDSIYLSPEKRGTAEITEKRSRFIGNIVHVDSEEEAVEFVKQIKREYYDAKHSAYAYITGGIKRYSDDGEPAKTAGLPILDMLDAQKITDCVCVVTRYFGGVLLGTGGLVRAYTLAAKNALEAAGIKKMTLHNKYRFTIPYSLFDSVKYVCSECECEIIDCSYTDVIVAEAVCETQKCENLTNAISGSFGINVKVEFVEKLYR
ncbi:MAG: YigZ family protein [Ruminococcaceae bacterium]|nr:YigZ family protein [Oscillospiraceae bacterium]